MYNKSENYLRFKGISDISSSLDSTKSDVSAMSSSILTLTTDSDTHYYANGTSGDDDNDGLTISTPKKTLQAVIDLVPTHIKHNVAIHLSGTFAMAGGVRLAGRTLDNSIFVLNGGEDEIQVVDDNSGANYSITDALTSKTSIGTTGAGWAINELQGYWVEVLTGDAAGERYTIRSNTADTITQCNKFKTDPGSSGTYRIVKPLTELQGSLTIVGNAGDLGITLQNVLFTGAGGTISVAKNMAPVYLSSIINEGTAYYSFVISYTSEVGYVNSQLNASTFASTLGAFATVSHGVSAINKNSTNRAVGNFDIRSSVLRGQNDFYNLALRISDGSYVKNIRIEGCGPQIGWTIPVVGQISTTYFNEVMVSNGTGIYVVNSEASFKNVIISDNSEVGIDAENSSIYFIASSVTGSGNTGPGFYPHDGTKAYMYSGNEPDVSGSVGYISLDGTTQKSTWAAIAATPINGSTAGNDLFVIVRTF